MPLVQSPLFGGSGGAAFDDTQSAPSPIQKMTALRIRHGEYIDAIQATYLLENGAAWTGPQHGGNGGSETTINLASDERVVSFLIRSGSLVDGLTVVTEQNSSFHEYGPYGGSGGGSNAVVGAIVALFGRSGSVLDAIGVWGNPPLSSSVSTPSEKELELEALAVKKGHAASKRVA